MTGPIPVEPPGSVAVHTVPRGDTAVRVGQEPRPLPEQGTHWRDRVDSEPQLIDRPSERDTL